MFTAIKSSWKDSGETIRVRVVPGGNFKWCCLPSGSFDGSNRSYFFPAVSGKTARDARKGGIMSVIQWASFAWKRRVSLCATCVWGTVRAGERVKEVETFCRLINPNTLVPFPVRSCTDYTDRSAAAMETGGA